MDAFSKYNVTARIFPTILGLIPLFLVQAKWLKYILEIDSILISILGNISLSLIIIYLVAQYVIRLPSKLFEDWLFRDQLYFPTTNFLLYADNEFTDDYKDEIRKSIKTNYSLNIGDRKLENNNELEARKRIKQAVKLIINKVKDGHLVLQHNIEYGFSRNLWGASIIGFFFSIILSVLSKTGSANRFIGLLLSFLYFSYLLGGSVIIKYYGKLYAKKLIEEYYEICHEK